MDAMATAVVVVAPPHAAMVLVVVTAAVAAVVRDVTRAHHAAMAHREAAVKAVRVGMIGVARAVLATAMAARRNASGWRCREIFRS